MKLFVLQTIFMLYEEIFSEMFLFTFLLNYCTSDISIPATYLCLQHFFPNQSRWTYVKVPSLSLDWNSEIKCNMYTCNYGIHNYMCTDIYVGRCIKNGYFVNVELSLIRYFTTWKLELCKCNQLYLIRTCELLCYMGL